MKKGIVMEINDAHLTLLTPSGEFLQARKQNQSYTIGEEISFFPIKSQTQNSAFSFLKLFKVKTIPAVLVALLLFLSSFIPMYQTNKAYAYMSIDVNPSIELGVNKKMQVVKLTPFNHDGKKVISHINDWRNESVSQLAQLIFKEMKKQGYLKDNHVVIISTVRTEKTERQAEEKLTENMNEIKDTVKKNNLQITVLTGTKKDMKNAHDLGITTGKYQENQIHSSHLNEKKQEPVEQEADKNAEKSVPKATQPADLPKKHEKHEKVYAPAEKEKEKGTEHKVNLYQKYHGQTKQVKEKKKQEQRIKVVKENKFHHNNDRSQINKKWKAKRNKHNQIKEHKKNDDHHKE